MVSSPPSRSYLRGKRKPQWKLLVIIVFLCGLGIADTVLLIYNYFFSQGECQILPFGLNVLGNDCATVTTSNYGTVLGFPLAIWGAIGYILILLFALISIREKTYLWVATLFAGFGGITSWTLTWIQHYLIGAFCPLCVLSMIIMTMVLIITLLAMIIYQPRILGGRGIGTAILLTGLISTSGLLSFKIIEDRLTSRPTDSLSLNSTVNDFPSGIIGEEIIYLYNIDAILKENISPTHWETLIQNTAYLDQAWVELRRRGLYLIAIEHWAKRDGKEMSAILNPVDTQNKISWEEFITNYLQVESLLESIQNQNLKGSAPRESDSKGSEEVFLSLPPNQQKIIDSVMKEISVDENIPPTHLYKPQ